MTILADLIPLISYLVLKARCRHCGVRIPLRYPIVELSNGLLFAYLFYRGGPELMTAKMAIKPYSRRYSSKKASAGRDIQANPTGPGAGDQRLDYNIGVEATGRESRGASKMYPSGFLAPSQR